MTLNINTALGSQDLTALSELLEAFKAVDLAIERAVIELEGISVFIAHDNTDEEWDYHIVGVGSDALEESFPELE